MVLGILVVKQLFGTIVNVSAMYCGQSTSETRTTGSQSETLKFLLQYSDLPWFACTRPNYFEFEQIPIEIKA